MKVLHIQYGMSQAGNAVYRLHEAMFARGIDSYCMVLSGQGSGNKVVGLGEKWTHKVVRAGIQHIVSMWNLRRLENNSRYYRDWPVWGRGATNHPLVKDADVIYLHWIANGISVKEVRSILSMGKPVLVFLHDMWMITGGCNSSFGCNQYMTGCRDCPMFSRGATIAMRHIRKTMDMFKPYRNVQFIAPSKWMKECALRSMVSHEHVIHHIPNLIDDMVFKPIDKKIARSILNLPQDKIIITFGCQSGVHNEIKGWKYLRDALNMLPYTKDRVELVIYGSNRDEEVERNVKYPVRFIGSVSDEHKLVLICNASSLFVSPSLSESFGMTLLENILCNTPVVSFDNTAIPETVKTGLNGYLAANKSTEDLAKGMEWTLSHYPENVRSSCGYLSSKVLDLHQALLNELLYS